MKIIFSYQKVIERLLNEQKVERVDNDEYIAPDDDTSKKIKDFTRQFVTDESKRMHEILNNQKDIMFEEDTLFDSEFKGRLEDRWNEGFIILQTIIKLSEEGAKEVIKDFFSNESQSEKNKTIMNVLFKLHSKSVQISQEVKALLFAGFPDGALSRWRSLHEFNIVFHILTLKFNDLEFTYNLVERYLDYSEIERSKEILLYNKTHSKLGLEPLSIEDKQYYKSKEKAVREKYEENFDKPNMWAKPLFHKNVKTIMFYHLEQKANIENLSPYYNQANQQVHASPKGIFRSNGYLPNNNQSFHYNYGASNYGLSLPGQLTAISLSQITGQLLNLNTNFDRLILTGVLNIFREDCKEILYSIQKEIEEEEDEINQENLNL